MDWCDVRQGISIVGVNDANDASSALLRGAVPRIAVPTPTSSNFDYNRRSWPMYAEAVRQAGGDPMAVDLAATEPELMRLARHCDGFLLPGSPADVDPGLYGHRPVEACAPADPKRQAADRLLLEEAYASGKPVLGICFGCQFLNVWRGGTLIQDLGIKPVNHSAGSSVAVAHSVVIAVGGILDRITDASERWAAAGDSRVAVNSSHHQSVDQLGEGLVVAGLSAEDGVIEAIEGSEPGAPEFVVGIQWHPERSTEISGTSRAIFRAFVDAAAVWKEKSLHQAKA